MLDTKEETIAVNMPADFFNLLCKRITDEDERIDFLPNAFIHVMHSIQVENVIYRSAEYLSTDYEGGFWEFAETKASKVPLIYPSGGTYKVSRYDDTYKLDDKTFGLIACIYAYSQGSFIFFDSRKDLSKRLSEVYGQLRSDFYELADDYIYNGKVESATEESIEQVKDLVSAVNAILD